MSDPAGMIGAVFAGCTIERMLGRGGMGTVYLGRAPDGTPRALKFLANEVAQNPALRERFEREGRALEKVPPHPNVVRVFGVHEDDLLDQLYIVMEFLEGSSLQELIEAQRRLPFGDGVRLALGAARGLEALHRCGLIHRDVKPANLLATPSGEVKVVDLGLAKDMFLSGLTEPGRALGTIQYMPPEQWEGAPASEGSDVFGLGATLHHLLTGEPPFVGDFARIREACLDGEVDDVREHAPDVPEAVAQVVLRMLRPSLHERYRSMRDVIDDLEGALSGEGPRAVPRLEATTSPPRRWALVGARRFTVGSEAGQDVRIEHPSISGRHARISRKAQGFVLRDLRSAHGTRVGGEPVTDRPRVLVDGDRVAFGQVELTFHDPTAGGQAAYLGDVARAVCAAPLLRALILRGDRRALLWLLEGLTPDPLTEASGRTLCAQLLGGAAAEAEAEVARAEAARRADDLRRLRALVGPEAPEQLDAWLGWWCQVRLEQPVQLAPPAPRRAVRLQVTGGAPAREVACGDVTLIGRDPKCQLVLERPDVARLQGMLVRLHRRFVLRAESGLRVAGAERPVALLDPGVPCELAGARLELRAEEERSPGQAAIDAARFAALARRAHPSTAQALVGALEDAGRDWRAPATALLPGDPAAAAQLAQSTAALARERAELAQAALPRLAGGDAGDDPAAWRALLAARNLGPQVLPVGW